MDICLISFSLFSCIAEGSVSELVLFYPVCLDTAVSVCHPIAAGVLDNFLQYLFYPVCLDTAVYACHPIAAGGLDNFLQYPGYASFSL